MARSPLSSAQQARAVVAGRLRELMDDAGISAREVAQRCNWHESKSSRLLSGTTPPSESDIRLWCAACGADSQAADLVAASKAAESSYASWSRIQREGLRQSQRQYIPLYERTKVIKVYTSNVIPGLFRLPTTLRR